MFILERDENRSTRRKNPRSTGVINYGNSSHMKYHTRLDFSSERHNALTACGTRVGGYSSTTNGIDIIEYATFRYDTIEVKNGF